MTCPACGYCPACGRRDAQPYTHWPWPYYRWNGPYYYHWVTNPPATEIHWNSTTTSATSTEDGILPWDPKEKDAAA